MAITTSLPLSNVLSVSVVVSPSGATGPTFNQGLIVGQSGVIGATERTRLYTSLSGVGADFPNTSPEYLAAQVYFAQSPTPNYLWIGCQVSTAIGSATVGTTGGTGYVVGDILTVVQGSNSTGQVKVTSINPTTGAVTGLGLIPGSQGYGYSVASNLATVGGQGNGAAVVNITVGETPAQAVAACRVLNPQWYACMVVGAGVQTTGSATSGSTSLTVASGTGIAAGQLVIGPGIPTNTTVASGSGTTWTLSNSTLAAIPLGTQIYFYTDLTVQQQTDIATYIQAATPSSVYFLSSGAAAILTNLPNNLFANLAALNVSRTMGVYSTPQNGQYLNNLFFAAAPMGKAMGLNTGATGSYFDLMFKTLTSVATEPLTQSQVQVISGSVDRSSRGLCGNLYLNYANGSYNWLQNATMFSSASNVFFDQVLFLDMLASQIQYNGVNLLTSVPALPITNTGVAMMVNVVSQACTQSQNIGFIAPAGVWQGVTVGPISYGTSLPQGFYVYSPPVSSLTQAQRAARIMPPMNVLLIEAQSGHSLSITVNVQP